MSIAVFTIVLFACVLLAIIVGIKLNINIGILAFVLSYLLGCLIMGYPPSKLWTFFPSKLMCNVFFITYFFGFAKKTETVEFIVGHILHAARKLPFLIPVVAFLIGAVLSAIGVLGPTICAIMAPIFLELAYKANISRKAMVCYYATGIMATIFFPTALVGNVLRGLLVALLPGMDTEVLAAAVSRGSLIVNGIIFVTVYIIFRGWKSSATKEELEVMFQKPAKATTAQKTITGMIIAVMVLLIVPSVFKAQVPVFAKIAAVSDASIFYLICGLICAFARFAPQKEVFSTIPWPMFFLLGGMTTLFALASDVGVTEFLGHTIASSMPSFIVVFVICALSGIMGIFSDGLGVVLPMMLPVAVAMAESTGLSANSLCAGICAAGFIAGLSPVSTAGAISLACTREEEQKQLFIFQLLFTVTAIILSGILAQIGII